MKFANKQFRNARENDPQTNEAAALLSWSVDRNTLGLEDSLVFVRAKNNDDYWQFVTYCWSGARRHRGTSGFYGVVYGPVNLDYQSRCFLADSDQISFHTKSSLKILQSVPPDCKIGRPQIQI